MVNANHPDRWALDIAESVGQYNTWFLEAAPAAYRKARMEAIESVGQAFELTDGLRKIVPAMLQSNPSILATLRMCTAPPLARDRLSGLSGVSKSLITSMEVKKRVPPRMKKEDLEDCLRSMCKVLIDLLDPDLFQWHRSQSSQNDLQKSDAATVIADRLCGSLADPIVRNAQEQRQLALIEQWLLPRGYRKKAHSSGLPLNSMEPGTFSFRQNIVVGGEGNKVNIPVDAVIQPHEVASHRFPVLIEAKSAGDFTNTNKRRKEEAQKLHQLKKTYGEDISLLLFLCGYFDDGYLRYSASEELDWVWEHRIDDLEAAGV